ncbi:hypothetical protein HPMBJEAJ_00384 [Aeromonas phage avDM6]|nr:hypothetical protein HPMBJEAJ_00384 [Aeromonas phage avDM6]
MIEAGKRYKIVKPVSNRHIVGVGDIIEISDVSWIGVRSYDISVNDYEEPYHSILQFEGPYTLKEYFEMVEQALVEVE